MIDRQNASPTIAGPSVGAARVLLDVISVVALASAVALVAAAVLVSAVLALSGRAHAGEPESGELLLKATGQRPAARAPRLVNEALSSASGMGTQVHVLQAYRNPADANVEGLYVFLLPEDAALERISIRVGGRAARLTTPSRMRISLDTPGRPVLASEVVPDIGPHETVAVELIYSVSTDGVVRPTEPAPRRGSPEAWLL